MEQAAAEVIEELADVTRNPDCTKCHKETRQINAFFFFCEDCKKKFDREGKEVEAFCV